MYQSLVPTLQVPSSKFQAPSSNLQVPSSKLQAPSSKFQAPSLKLPPYTKKQSGPSVTRLGSSDWHPLKASASSLLATRRHIQPHCYCRRKRWCEWRSQRLKVVDARDLKKCIGYRNVLGPGGRFAALDRRKSPGLWVTHQDQDSALFFGGLLHAACAHKMQLIFMCLFFRLTKK